MFVFWYCHKRGKEVRLAREAEDQQSAEATGDEAELSEGADDNAVEEMVEELEKTDEQQQQQQDGQGMDEKQKVLDQPAPSEVRLPETAAESEGQANEKKETSTSA